MESVLTLSDIRMSFGGVTVIDGLSLDVYRGEIHGLIGPNGAGKTTAINIATGIYVPRHGKVLIEGREVTAMPPHRRSRQGLSRTFQGGRPFGAMTVRENVQTALERRRRCLPARSGTAAPPLDAERLLAEIGILEIANLPAANLPYGKQKQLEIARALAFATSCLLLDEPTAGLSSGEIDLVLQVITRHRERLGILLIEHDMDVVMSLCDRITVLDAGRWLTTGTPAEVQRNPDVVSAYLGPANEAHPC